jgi:AcrR family transcriptional regulator
MAGERHDPRVVRTRGAIVKSFNGMFPTRPYDTIRVADIIEKAGIGRSTFYEHFRGKDEVFKHAAAWVLAALADAVTVAADPALLRHLVEHLRENRRVARERLTGEPARQFGRWLAEAIAVRLPVPPIIPVRLAAEQIATAQIALLRAWLDGRNPCSAEALATALARTSRAMATAVTPPSTS